MTHPNLPRLARAVWSDPQQAVRFARNRLASARYFVPGVLTAPPPSVVYVAVNSRCNLRCRMCDVGLGETDTPFHDKLAGPHRDMGIDEFRALVDSVCDHAPLVSLTSTEPLLWPHLEAALAHVASRDMHAAITTNGYLLPRMAAMLVRVGLRTLSVSLDGPPRIHNAVRGVADSFQHATEGIRLVQEEKARLGRTWPQITINCTITADSHAHIAALMPHLRSLRPDLVTVSHMNFVTDEQAEMHNRLFSRIGTSRPMCTAGVNPRDVDPGTLASQLAEMLAAPLDAPVLLTPPLTTSDDIAAYYREPFRHFGHRTCFIPWKHAQVLADGRLTVLTRCFDVSFGNVFETPLPILWNGDSMRTFRAALKAHGRFPACLRCCGLF
ncbi:MoaA/NifB/PqqE/SkfB family radical SAM enzyme [Desulfobaculum xiamenense]|uniref:MoaA/NifB/PqqE/SkfB family radical SAM enzyme n=1 Tax=Desulfobaculum xiamenense TaxID=995050 RepID=A0A846QUM2_9BACT|nr:radical SAM protein [Desulfobaculum xiamenense]NJB69225.1 MoaA/NifB/PqqE/SkfB family radical SAM enzyme [Desulfobaculum xiamenense]